MRDNRLCIESDCGKYGLYCTDHADARADADIAQLRADLAAAKATIATLTEETLWLKRDLHADGLARRNADDVLLRIAALFNAWANGDEPEGAPSARRTLQAIGDVLGPPWKDEP